MARNYAALPHEYLEEMEALNDAEFGRLTRALLTYSMTGEPIALCGNERFYARRVMAQEDRFQESYNDTSDKRSEAGKKGAAKRWQTDSKNGNAILPLASDSKNGNTETKTKTETNTLPSNDGKSTPAHGKKAPTFEQVEEFAKMRRSTVDPRQFFEYYAAAGWLDAEGKPVYNWQQKFLAWEMREQQNRADREKREQIKQAQKPGGSHRSPPRETKPGENAARMRSYLQEIRAKEGADSDSLHDPLPADEEG